MLRLVIFFLLFLNGFNSTGVQAARVDDLLFGAVDKQYSGEYVQAEQAFRKVLNLDSANVFALNRLALCVAQQGRFTEASALFRRLLVLDPTNSYASNMLGVLRLADGDANARKDFVHTLSFDPQNADAYYFLGMMALADHDYEQAVSYLHKAGRLSLDDPDLHASLGKAFTSLGMLDDAERELDKALLQDHGNIRALNTLGAVNFQKGQPDAARLCWERALKLNSRNEVARMSLARLYNMRAEAAQAAGESKKAERLWCRVLVVDGGNRAAKYHLRKVGSNCN